VEIKCQLDATEVFVADLIACPTCLGHHYTHHQELQSIIRWLLPVVFRAEVFKFLVWCGAEGYVSGLQDAAAAYILQTTLRDIFFFFNRHCNPCGFWPAQISLSILSRKVFTECRFQLHVKPPTWRTNN